MGAEGLDQAERAAERAEQDQILAKQAHWQRLAALELYAGRDREPISAQQRPHCGAGTYPSE